MTFILIGVCPLITFPAYATANFSKGSIVRLLATKDGAYDLACALDFDGVGLYDMLVYLSSLPWSIMIRYVFFSFESRKWSWHQSYHCLIKYHTSVF